jgi:hypothetical protein
MALRLRRGTDAQRQLITPSEGELIYVTDTTELYVGDGTTLGGIRISGEVVDTLNQLDDVDAALPQDGDVLVYDSATGDWVAGELPLGDLSDVEVSGVLDGQVLAFDAATTSWVPANNVGGGDTTFSGDLVGSVFADDSTIMVDAVSARFFGRLEGTTVGQHIGNVDGDLSGNVNGTVFGELSGSVFGDDSSLIVDGPTGFINSRKIDAGASRLHLQGDTLGIVANDGNTVQIGGTDYDGTFKNNTLSIARNGTSGIAFSIETYHESDNVADFRSVKYRGTTSAPATYQNGDRLLEFVASGYDGSTISDGGFIKFIADGSAANSLIPAKVQLQVPNATATAGITYEGNKYGTWSASQLMLTPLDAEPTDVAEGMIAVADRATWDPAAKGSGGSYVVYYDGSAWNAMS